MYLLDIYLPPGAKARKEKQISKNLFFHLCNINNTYI